MTTTATERLTPAQRLDHRSRIARTIARILMERVVRVPDLAAGLAEEIAEGLIEEHGGDRLYVPTTNQRAGLTDWHLIEARLRQDLSPPQLAGQQPVPGGVVTAVAQAAGVSPRTVYRVLALMREAGAPAPAPAPAPAGAAA